MSGLQKTQSKGTSHQQSHSRNKLELICNPVFRPTGPLRTVSQTQQLLPFRRETRYKTEDGLDGIRDSAATAIHLACSATCTTVQRRPRPEAFAGDHPAEGFATGTGAMSFATHTQLTGSPDHREDRFRHTRRLITCSGRSHARSGCEEAAWIRNIKPI